ncbi:Type IV secretion-system coupling protein DNA-binding domain protein [Phycisphaerae bacterium RAS1]|nr:Type IV secretion-system coupling protein DNA-binding domain protein [Phycisphaerae bacterium RAS1]
MGWLIKTRARSAAKSRWDRSSPLLYWADGVPWNVESAFSGTQIWGSTGSGKTSGSLAAICRAFLAAGFGGLFLCAKREDRDTYTRYAREAGRLDDLMVFSPETNELRYNFIESERRQSAGAVGLVENLTALLMTVTELTERGNGGGGGRDNERYFRLESTRLARNGLLALVLGRERVTVPDLHRLITTAPVSLEQVASTDWQNSSFCFQCLHAADQASKNDSQRADFDLALTYFLNEWPALSSRTRSVVQSTLTSATDALSRGAARDLLSSPNPNVSPEMMYDGKVLIADFPVLVYRDIGQLIQVILKFCWQRSHSQRNVAANPRPTFIVCDESHLLAVDADQTFQTIARSTRTAVVYATQSISTYLDVFGAQAEPKVHTLLGNLQTQVFHQQTDVKTIQYVQELIGRSRQFVMNGNSTRDNDWLSPLFGGTPGGASAGFSETYEFELQASDLNSLAKGQPPLWETHAIVYQGGRRFPNGRTWFPVAFRQTH